MTEPDYKKLSEALALQLKDERPYVWGFLDRVRGELLGIKANLVPDDMECPTYIHALLAEAIRLASLGPTPIERYYNRFGCKIEVKSGNNADVS